jgi:thiamine pyrophosphokinase
LNIIPNYLIGDLDSASEEEVLWAQENNVQIIKYPFEKDETDTELALAFAKKLKIFNTEISGVLGKRIDHSLASFYLIAKYGFLNPKIVEEYLESGFLSKSKEFEVEKDETWSVFQIGGDAEISLSGFKYELNNFHIEKFNPIGVSNQTVKNKVKISIHEGSIIYIRWLKNIY